MELMLRDGDYVADGRGGVKRTEGGEEVLQRVLFQLGARRGAFPLLPQVGSELWRLPRAKGQQREALAAQYVSQALAGEQDLEVTECVLEEREGSPWLTVRLTLRGTPLEAELAL